MPAGIARSCAGDGEIVLIDDDHKPRLTIHAEHVDDPATLAQVSKAIKKKYGWTHPQYLPRFLDDDSVAATLRLEVQPIPDNRRLSRGLQCR